MIEQYLDAVLASLTAVQDPKLKLVLRDLSIDLTNQLNNSRMSDTMDAVSKIEGEAVTLEDAVLVDLLVGKGIHANGMNPELTTAQVGRALSVLTHSLTRTIGGTISLEDTQALEQVFDTAIEMFPAENRAAYRFLESKVRLGLSLPPRGLGAKTPEHLA